jgi:arsenate reductase-like glutaredoxin family protein
MRKMKLYNFEDFLQDRFSEEEIATIKEAARIEAESLMTTQQQVSETVGSHMTDEEKMKMRLYCLAEIARIGQEIENEDD